MINTREYWNKTDPSKISSHRKKWRSKVNYLFRGHSAIGLETMFEAIKLPTGVAHLDSSLTNVDRKAFSHFELVLGF
jgi:hypothetical protein